MRDACSESSVISPYVTCTLGARGCRRAVASMIRVLGRLGLAGGVYQGVCREGKVTCWSVF